MKKAVFKLLSFPGLVWAGNLLVAPKAKEGISGETLLGLATQQMILPTYFDGSLIDLLLEVLLVCSHNKNINFILNLRWRSKSKRVQIVSGLVYRGNHSTCYCYKLPLTLES